MKVSLVGGDVVANATEFTLKADSPRVIWTTW